MRKEDVEGAVSLSSPPLFHPTGTSSSVGQLLTDGGRDGQVGDGGPENGHECPLRDGYSRVLGKGGGEGVSGSQEGPALCLRLGMGHREKGILQLGTCRGGQATAKVTGLRPHSGPQSPKQGGKL